MSGGNAAKSRPVTVREATRADIPALVELNRAAYPTLAEDNVVWRPEHLANHQRVFPQGQLIAESGGRILGACASLIVDLGPDPLRNHTWAGITDSGYFNNHTPRGDTLYGADVYVHPDARGKGVGRALYDARRRLCQRLNLRRILAGGRLWNYEEQAPQLSAEEYASRVVTGEFRDLVLSFQLSQGFTLRGVMPHYLHDPLSKNYASLIEWINPDHKPPATGPRKVRLACVQYQMRKLKSFDQFAKQVSYFVDVAADYGAQFVLLPELFTVQLLSQLDAVSPQEGMRKLSRYTSRLRKLFTKLAAQYGVVIIGGSHPVWKGERLFNVCHICLPDQTIIEQPKLHITPNERKWWGMSGGENLAVVDTPHARIAVLICYDIEFPEAARYLADEGAELIFVPFCTDSRQSYLRVRYCAQARAIENQVYVALAGNVGNLPDVTNMDVQYGQAAVFTPADFAFARDGIAAEADSNEETVLVCDLDLDALHGARSSGTVTPRLDRRPDMFRYVARMHGQWNSSMIVTDHGPLGSQPAISIDGASGVNLVPPAPVAEPTAAPAQDEAADESR